jgi:3-hydroxyisobutyrate dehydrogenase
VSSGDRRTTQVVDTSTIGPSAARRIEAELVAQEVGYVDAPVSGGVAGARARTLMVMYSGREEACAASEPVLAGLSDRRRWVGDRAGLAQALKLANNVLSATALAATTEAVAFGTAAGLDPEVMLDVLRSSSGANTATSDKFPNHVVTDTYASGFANTLMAKDVSLYLAELGATGGPDSISRPVVEVWRRFAEAEPGVDFTRIFPHLAGRRLAR